MGADLFHTKRKGQILYSMLRLFGLGLPEDVKKALLHLTVELGRWHEPPSSTEQRSQRFLVEASLHALQP